MTSWAYLFPKVRSASIPKSIEGFEKLSVPKNIDALFHPRERVGVFDGHGIEFSVVNAESNLTVFLGSK